MAFDVWGGGNMTSIAEYEFRREQEAMMRRMGYTPGMFHPSEMAEMLAKQEKSKQQTTQKEETKPSTLLLLED